jgi:hypothetical protein
MRRLAAAAFLASLLLAGCAHTDRPEGVVERWLTSLNQGGAGRPDRFTLIPGIEDPILPDWEHCDPGALDVIEVGRGRAGVFASAVDLPQYVVPIRIEYANDLSSLCDHLPRSTAPKFGSVLLVNDNTSDDPDWRIAAAGPRTFGLRVPSEGGHLVTNTSALLWLAGLAIGLALCGLVALLMAATPRAAPVTSEPLDPSEARGL